MTAPDTVALVPGKATPGALPPGEVAPALDPRLARLQAELDNHARVARYLRLDFGRPVRSLADGYPENAVALVGKITERLLRQLWIHHAVPGTPTGKTLKDLIGGCRPYIRSHRVLEALHEIQRLRNRSAHDGGYPIADEDALLAIRRLLDILDWYTSTGSGALTRHAPRLAPQAAAKAEWLAGLCLTLDYRLASRRELTQHAACLLFARERGLRAEHAELLLCQDAAEAAQVLSGACGEIFRAGLACTDRFLVLEQDADGAVPGLPPGCQVVAYERFLDTFVDIDQHLAGVAAAYPPLPSSLAPVRADVLRADDRSAEMTVTMAGDARDLLGEVAAAGGNMLVVGRPGSGKTTLLKQLVTTPACQDGRRYRFLFDLSLKSPQETFAAFVTRTLAPCMRLEAGYVFPAFCYLTRSGSALCALDGFDEAAADMTLPGLLALFTEVAQVLSAESATVLTSRVSFLDDSPQVRRLLDGTSLISERLAQQLHAHGVDPLRVPRFSVLRLHDQPGGSFLAQQLRRDASQATARTDGHAAGPADPDAAHAGQPGGPAADLADLLWARISTVTGPELLPRVVDYLGLAFLRGITVFTLIDLVNVLGIEAFADGHVGPASFRLRDLFRPASPDGTALALRHAAYQEMLAAEFLRSQQHRAAALAATPHPRLTEEVREFLYRRSRADGSPATAGGHEDCVVPAGIYLVGPAHHLMLRELDPPVEIDQFPVTVARYKRFLKLAGSYGPTRWDHPDAPAGHDHQPRPDRLPVPSYYTDPAYDDHPAVAVTWWSAWALAASEGKRLPTSLEWEAAARGFDGRLFPWGDEVDLSAVNCADSWSDRPLITYAAWRAERDQGRLAGALPGAVDAHPHNASPFGVRELGGNVWEWTSTVLGGCGEAVICGGSYDNPYRAVQASSKGTCHRQAASSVVGFRCARDIP